MSAFAFFPFAAPGALGSEVAMWKFAAEELGADTPLDFAAPKPRGEVLLTAKAFPRGGTARPACSVRVRLGAVDKTLYVVGDRRWRHGAATDPEPFTQMPITWANAFGGAGHAPNPLGKGHESTRDGRGENQPLPNIEDPKRLVSSPNDRPLPAGFGPYDLTWPQRYSKIGTYDAKWLADRYPGFAADFDPGFFNAAPADQQIEGYFRGDEAFTLENLHPDKPVLEGRLPAIKARIFLNFQGERIRAPGGPDAGRDGAPLPPRGARNRHLPRRGRRRGRRRSRRPPSPRRLRGVRGAQAPRALCHGARPAPRPEETATSCIRAARQGPPPGRAGPRSRRRPLRRDEAPAQEGGLPRHEHAPEDGARPRRSPRVRPRRDGGAGPRAPLCHRRRSRRR